MKGVGTGLTGLLSRASVRPNDKPRTACRPCQTEGGINSDSTAHLKMRLMRPDRLLLTFVAAQIGVDHALAHRFQGQGAEFTRRRSAVEFLQGTDRELHQFDFA